MVKVADQVAELAFENGLKVSASIADSLLPTPSVAHLRNHDEPVEDYLERRAKAESGEYRGMPGVSLGVAVRMEMLPTPTTQDGKNTAGASQFERNTLPLNAEVTLLPTVQADDAKNTGHNQDRRTTLASEVWLAENTLNWGKFEPAIRRWEKITRKAPAPTKPDGKDGAHRLSAEFTEWMMGLSEGWVTAPDLGLKRNDQLKACGNGVVPQQAELALRMLLDGVDLWG
jgi:DNA (cytosine-5)-methyltransferase 1